MLNIIIDENGNIETKSSFASRKAFIAVMKRLIEITLNATMILKDNIKLKKNEDEMHTFATPVLLYKSGV